MAQTVPESSAPGIVIFNTSSVPSSLACDTPVFMSWGKGPQKLSGFVKRGRPKKEHQKAVSGHDNEKLHRTPKTLSLNFINYVESPQNSSPEIKRVIRSNAMRNYRHQERKRNRISDETQDRSDDSSDHFLKANENGELQQNQDSVQLHPSLSTGSTNQLLPKVIPGVDPFDSFQIKIEPYMLDLLSCYATSIYEIMYSIEKLASFNPVTECWLPMAFEDMVLFHAIVFCADGYGSSTRTRKESPTAVGHLGRAIQILNKRLLAPVPNITDATIVVVCSLAHTEILNGKHKNWSVHMGGLKKMVENRGGIQAFKSNRMVLSKITRADLCGSLDVVQKPYFDFPSDSLVMPGYVITTAFHGIQKGVHLDEVLGSVLSRIQDVATNMSLLHTRKLQIHPLTLREDITSLQYTLLSTELKSDNLHSGLVNEVLRLGLLAYLVTLLDESPPGSAKCGIRSAKLASALQKLKLHEGLALNFRAWLLFVAASDVASSETKAYFLAAAVETLLELEVSCWEDLRMILKSFFWVEEIHERKFKAIWDGLEIVLGNGLD